MASNLAKLLGEVEGALLATLTELSCICECCEGADTWMSEKQIRSARQPLALDEQHYGLISVRHFQEEYQKLTDLPTWIGIHVFALCSPSIVQIGRHSVPSAFSLSLDFLLRAHFSLTRCLRRRNLSDKESIDATWSQCHEAIKRLELNRDFLSLLRAHLDREIHFVAQALDRGTISDADYVRWMEQKRTEPLEQADKKTDSSKKIRSLLPANPDVVELARRIKKNKQSGHSKRSIANDFTDGDEAKAQSLLRQLRSDRYGHLLQ